MKISAITLIGCLLCSLAVKAQESGLPLVKKNIPLDSIVLSDPFIMSE